MTTGARVVRFWSVGAAGILVQMATLAALVHGVGAHYSVATVVAVAAAVVHNFLWHRVWTWGDRRGHASPLSSFARFAAANGLVSVVGNLGVMSVLVGLAGIAAVPANAMAIAICGAVNYWVADRKVFGERTV